MKRSIFLTAILAVAINCFSFANEKRPAKTEPAAPITNLVVNADVTVVLVNSDRNPANMIGDPFFMSHVSFKQNGNTLVVKSEKSRNLKDKGIIYVPASHLQSIQVNSAALIKSAGILNIPELKVQVNGHCKLHVYTTGKVTPQSNAYDVNVYSRNLFEPVPFSINHHEGKTVVKQ